MKSKKMTEEALPRRRAAAPRNDGKVALERVAQAVGVWPSTGSRRLNGTAVVADEERQAVE